MATSPSLLLVPRAATLSLADAGIFSEMKNFLLVYDRVAE
jgi:hypothetical protein